MILHIKNMVCARCIMAVADTLSNLGLTPDSVALGEAHIAETLTAEQTNKVRDALKAIGFDLVEEKNDLSIQQVKQAVLAPPKPLCRNGLPTSFTPTTPR